MSWITHEQFLHMERTDIYYRDRWPYLKVARDMSLSVEPKNILEAGPGPLCKPIMNSKADTIDLKEGATIVHDLTKTPWPIGDKAYDLFIALQVWEHLGASQEDAFKEVCRVSKNAVLSFPFWWKRGSKEHLRISLATIRRWTLNTPMHSYILVDKPSKAFRRLVCLFRDLP